LTITGSVDPYEIIVRARKASKYAEVVWIGPPLGPPKDKKPAEKKPDPTKHNEGLIDDLIQRFMVGHFNFIIPVLCFAYCLCPEIQTHNIG
jgi:hypothetical protein